ncbi:MAG: hypothetical protein H6594_08610 [Flavobacteriales bacterium]|nr:hypothetical protein [Flavobacteriales bacterium]
MKDRTWPVWWMALGILTALAALLTFGKIIVAPISTSLRWLVGSCLIGLLVPHAWSGARLGLERSEWRFLWALGIGPSLFALGLVLNQMFHGPVHCVDHPVERVVNTGFVWRVDLMDGALEAYPLAREHYLDPGLARGDDYPVCEATGLFGGRVVVHR